MRRYLRRHLLRLAIGGAAYGAIPAQLRRWEGAAGLETALMGVALLGAVVAAHALWQLVHLGLAARPFEIVWPTSGSRIPEPADGLRHWLFTFLWLLSSAGLAIALLGSTARG
jgi:hypothetical protein